MPEVIFIKRETTDTPYGFKLQGGADFAVPLSILQVTPNSIAERVGLKPGDAIIKINDAETSWMEHSRAKQELIRSGNEIRLTVERNAVDTAKPAFTPLAQLKTNPPVPKSVYTPPPPPPPTDLTVDKGETIRIGSSHNRAPMPFNREIGNTIDYKAAKPTNWKAGDYTQWTPGNNQENNNSPTVTAVFHNQYNTPIGIYSDSNVFQEFQNQTKGIMPETTATTLTQNQNVTNNNNINNNVPSIYQNQQNQNFVKQLKSSSAPRGTNSLSMRMLNTGIEQVEGTNKQPPSVFDLKSGENPTGATVPRGFRSVQAPVALPPDQRHAPVRKEFQVHHVQQNWIEPRIN